MKKIAAIAVAGLVLIAANLVPQEEYIRKYSAIAVSEMQRTGVPASITLAQGIVESRSGQSPLAVEANNHFGIKCHSDWEGGTFRQDDDKNDECFRAYASAEESFIAHSDFLRSSQRYADLFELDPEDYKGWAKGLSKAGYATDPKYASKLIRVIEDYDLQKYDTGEIVPDLAELKWQEDGEIVAVLSDVPLDDEDEVSVEFDAKSKPARKGAQVRSIKYSEDVLFSMGRPVYYKDGAKCLQAMKGETYESIARDCGLFKSEIRRFNSVKKGDELEAGTYVFVQKPRTAK